MDDKGNTREDLSLPNETDDDSDVANRIKDAVENGRTIFVTVLNAMGIEKVIEAKEK
jgi:hypothetical protein